jgi:hypothetical protein
LVRAEAEGFGAFRLRGGKRDHLAAPFVQELQGEMAEPADADDTDPVGRSDAALDHGIEDGDAAAKQRTGLGRIDRGRQRHGPFPVAAHPLGKPAVPADHGRLDLRAEVVIAAQALGTAQAAAGKPTQPNPVTDLDALHLRTGLNHGADDLVTRDERVVGEAPIVVEH